MADPQELQERQVVPKEPGARRSMVEEVENTTGDLDRRIVALTAQVAELRRRLDTLEASRDQAQADGGADRSGSRPDLAERMRQLDERLQKLANILTQQTWGTGRS